MNVNVTNILKKVKDFLKPQVALFIAAILLFVSIFMPIMTPKKDARRELKKQIEYAEMMDNDSMRKECEAMLKPSTAKLFSTFVPGLISGELQTGEAALLVVPVIALPLILIVATVILAFFRKPHPVVILSVINFIVLLIQKALFNLTFIKEASFKWDFGNGFMFFAVIFVTAVAIWNIRENKKAKKTCADVIQ
ncbi:MAG: hypothetical protein IKM25_02975 [Clostridia bacterium]|nr:hypothetical protein [Clostridia bacterium]